MPRHIACLTFDFDAMSGMIAWGLTSPTPISRGEFGAIGVRRILALLAKYRIKATFFIPGVVIGQHQGGGKAEQIFLRGFDCDHGTDIRLEADGMPINMVSHAHGQGFADDLAVGELVGCHLWLAHLVLPRGSY